MVAPGHTLGRGERMPSFQNITGPDSRETEEPIFLQFCHVSKHFQSPGNTLFSLQNKMRLPNDEMSLELTFSGFVSELPLLVFFLCHPAFFKTSFQKSKIESWGIVHEMDWISCQIFFWLWVWMKYRWSISGSWGALAPSSIGTFLWLGQCCRYISADPGPEISPHHQQLESHQPLRYSLGCVGAAVSLPRSLASPIPSCLSSSWKPPYHAWALYCTDKESGHFWTFF